MVFKCTIIYNKNFKCYCYYYYKYSTYQSYSEWKTNGVKGYTEQIDEDCV